MINLVCKTREIAIMQNLKEIIQSNAGTVTKLTTKRRIVIHFKVGQNRLSQVSSESFSGNRGMPAEEAKLGGTRTSPTVFVYI